MTLPLPQKRLIVFAGLASHKPRMAALRERRVEAVMFSYMKAYESKTEDAKVRAAIQEWPTLKLLDSGVFTFLRATGQLRAKAKEKGKGPVKKITREEFDAYAETYFDYLKAHHEDWDFVVELDVDNIFGPEVAREYRIRLRELVGDKLIPVWHTIAEPRTWKEFYTTFPFIGTGSDKPMFEPYYRQIVNEAHAAGAKVHGFGGTRVDVLEQIPYDTCDSTTWLAAVRYGQYGGHNYRRESKATTAVEVRKGVLGGFEAFVEELGYVPHELVEPGSAQFKYDVAIRLFQQRQNNLPPIKKEITIMEPIIEL